MKRILLTACFAVACSPSPQDEPDVSIDMSTTDDVAVDARDMRSEDAANDTSGESTVPDGCNPIAYEHDCLFPFPSDTFRTENRVVVGGAALPRDKFGEAIDAFDISTADGFSVHPSIVFDLGPGLSNDSMLPWDRADESTTPDSPTILLDAETLELVPHFSEVYLGGDEETQVGAIRPLGRLQNGRRYVVAVKDVETLDGEVAEPPVVFAAFRDAESTYDGRFGELRTHYEDEVFALLTEAGVERDDLQLAWDFTVRSEANLTGDMFSVREQTLAWLENNTPVVTITEVREGEQLGASLRENTFRHVEGTFTAPAFMEANEPGSELRGARGDREYFGSVTVPFSLTIPNNVAVNADQRPARFLQFGHGFFGERQEVLSFVQSRFGNEFGFVMASIDWWGMSVEDRDWVINRLAEDPRDAFRFVPRVHQAMANQIVFTEVIRDQLHSLPELQVEDAAVYDPAKVYFFGISQGHILGGTFMALTPSIERAVLNVGGASLGFILTRSYAFLIFERLLGQWMEPRDLLAFETMATTPLEMIDPVAFAPYVVSDPPEGAAERSILLQGALGDAAVPNLSMDLHARALGIPLLAPSPRDVPALETAPYPAANGIVYTDFSLEVPLARPWDQVNRDNIAHEGLRRYGPIRSQIDQFFQPDGMIEDVCDGACVAN